MILRCLLAAAAFVPFAATAQESTPVGEIYQSGAWTVDLYQNDDQSLSCIAHVDADTANLAVWGNDDGTVHLGLSSENWGFDPATENYLIEIDEQGEWTLGEPEINGDSLFIAMEDDKASVDFLTEIATGTTAYLRNSSGELLAEPFSLEGSNEAMQAMSGCLEGLAS